MRNYKKENSPYKSISTQAKTKPTLTQTEELSNGHNPPAEQYSNAADNLSSFYIQIQNCKHPFWNIKNM